MMTKAYIRPRLVWHHAIIATCLMATAAVAEPSSISGLARVVDGDTVAIGLTVVRLKGVDAPEMRQVGGAHAKQVMLEGIVGDGPLTCQLTGEKPPSPRGGV